MPSARPCRATEPSCRLSSESAFSSVGVSTVLTAGLTRWRTGSFGPARAPRQPSFASACAVNPGVPGSASPVAERIEDLGAVVLDPPALEQLGRDQLAAISRRRIPLAQTDHRRSVEHQGRVGTTQLSDPSTPAAERFEPLPRARRQLILGSYFHTMVSALVTATMNRSRQVTMGMSCSFRQWECLTMHKIGVRN